MKKFTLILLALGIAFFSCDRVEDLDNLSTGNLDREFAIPIGKANFSIRDLVETVGDSTLIFIDPDSTIRLNYKGNLTNETANEAIFDAIRQTLMTLPQFPILDTVTALPFSNTDGIDIDYMDLKTGKLTIVMENGTSNFFQVDWEFTNVFSADGEKLKGKFLAEPNDTYAEIVDISSFTLRPESGEIKLRYVATNIATRERVTLRGFTMGLSDITFDLAEGYFDQIVYEGTPDTIELDIFENWQRGDILFDNPVVKIYSENSFGIPTRAVVNYFDVRTKKFGTLPLESPSQNIIDFAYPEIDEVGQIKFDTFVYNAENSNIEDILFGGPQAIQYDIDAITNPDRDTAIRGFVSCESYYQFIIEADLPLHGRATGFAVSDTLEWNFADYDDVEHAEFKLVTDNELGLEIVAQGYFLDENDVVLDSLFDGSRSIMTAAPTTHGYASGSARTETFVPFDESRFEKIKPATKLLLAAEFYSPSNGAESICVQVNQGAEIGVGMKFGLK